MQAIGPECRFVQQYDPFTGTPSVICEPGQPPQDAYGPAMLSVLNTPRACMASAPCATPRLGQLLRRGMPLHPDGQRPQLGNRQQRARAEAFVDGRKVFTAGPDSAHHHRPAGAYPARGPLRAGRRFTRYKAIITAKKEPLWNTCNPGGLPKAMTFSYDDGQVL